MGADYAADVVLAVVVALTEDAVYEGVDAIQDQDYTAQDYNDASEKEK